MKLEVTKVYRTSMTVNSAKNFTRYYELTKTQTLTLSETIEAEEKQSASITVKNPKSYEIKVSNYQKGHVSLSLISKPSQGLEWLKFDAQRIAGKLQKFEAPIELHDDEVIEITAGSNSGPPHYGVSFRFKIIQH